MKIYYLQEQDVTGEEYEAHVIDFGIVVVEFSSDGEVMQYFDNMVEYRQHLVFASRSYSTVVNLTRVL